MFTRENDAQPRMSIACGGITDTERRNYVKTEQSQGAVQYCISLVLGPVIKSFEDKVVRLGQTHNVQIPCVVDPVKSTPVSFLAVFMKNIFLSEW